MRKSNLLRLASPRTQQRWLSNFTCVPGLNNEFLTIIQKKLVGCEPKDRNAMLCFDEMEIKNKYEYDARSKQVYGNAKKLQVVMARGLTSKWKQIIFFDFNTPMTKSLMEQIILACEKKGLLVRGITFDLGNPKFQSETGIPKLENSMTNPMDPTRKVFLFPDIPHMVKLLRNHCLDAGLAFPNENGVFTELKMKDFKEIMQKDGEELKLCPKLKPIHLTAQGSMRQRVCLATQLFSHTVAKAMVFHQGESAEGKSNAILTVNNYFDTMNSRTLHNAVPYRCALGVHEELQIESLLRMKKLVETMKFCNDMGKRTMKPFQKGILISIQSTLTLFQELKVRVHTCNEYYLNYI